jgi:hypothetical protein
MRCGIVVCMIGSTRAGGRPPAASASAASRQAFFACDGLMRSLACASADRARSCTSASFSSNSVCAYASLTISTSTCTHVWSGGLRLGARVAHARLRPGPRAARCTCRSPRGTRRRSRRPARGAWLGITVDAGVGAGADLMAQAGLRAEGAWSDVIASSYICLGQRRPPPDPPGAGR